MIRFAGRNNRYHHQMSESLDLPKHAHSDIKQLDSCAPRQWEELDLVNLSTFNLRRCSGSSWLLDIDTYLDAGALKKKEKVYPYRELLQLVGILFYYTLQFAMLPPAFISGLSIDSPPPRP